MKTTMGTFDDYSIRYEDIKFNLNQLSGGKYTLEEYIGNGSQGNVYRISDGIYDYALKVMPVIGKVMEACGAYDDDMYQEIKRVSLQEINTMEQYKNCPHIAQLMEAYEIRTDEGLIAYYYEIQRLYEDIDGRFSGPTADREMIKMGMDICRAISELQGKSNIRVVHRDIKLGNILYDDDAECYILADLGSTRILTHADSTVTRTLFTSAFAAPELESRYQVLGKYYGKHGEQFKYEKWMKQSHQYRNYDIYGLGMTMFYLLSGGKFPKDFKNERQMLKNVNPDLRKVIFKAISDAPAKRYPSEKEMLADLAAIAPNRRKASKADRKPGIVKSFIFPQTLILIAYMMEVFVGYSTIYSQAFSNLLYGSHHWAIHLILLLGFLGCSAILCWTVNLRLLKFYHRVYLKRPLTGRKGFLMIVLIPILCMLSILGFGL